MAQNVQKKLEERTDAKVILTREDDTSLLPGTNQKEELQALKTILLTLISAFTMMLLMI
ncbi:hypothetical protein bcgnr5386_53210 [Bacillus cereus]